MEKKSIDLMIAIVRFFNSALVYLGGDFFGELDGCELLKVANVLKSLVNGPRAYEDGKNVLDTAIREYDQAVFDLAASVVASKQLLIQLLICY